MVLIQKGFSLKSSLKSGFPKEKSGYLNGEKGRWAGVGR